MSQIEPLKVKQESLKQYLEKAKGNIRAALPASMPVDRFMRMIFTAVHNNPALLECSKESIYASAIECAKTGLEPGVLGWAYFLPRKNRKKGVVECNFQTGYMGLIELCLRSERVVSMDAEVVYEDDEFHISLGTDRRITHVPSYNDMTDAKIIGAYAVATLRDGGKVFRYMPRQEILKHRALSADPNGMLWSSHFPPACKKTVIRDLCKYLPKAYEAQTQVALEDEREAGVETDFSVIPDAAPIVNGNANANGSGSDLLATLGQPEEAANTAPESADPVEAPPKPFTPGPILKKALQKIGKEGHDAAEVEAVMGCALADMTEDDELFLVNAAQQIEAGKLTWMGFAASRRAMQEA